jgi:hypothetical protein
MAEGSRSGSPQLPKQRDRGLKVPRHHADVLILAIGELDRVRAR